VQGKTVSTLVSVEAASGSGPSTEIDGLLPPLRPGTTVGGKYVIQQVIGSGGNGTVYEAKHATIGHRVAIKVVHASLSGRSEVLARFGREARICAGLRHPNLGQVYDVGLLEGGTPYMVMELQEGISLARIVEETTLSIEAIVVLGQQLLAGLQCVHDGGVIHRDVKPDNVMVVRDAGGQVIVKLLDFGIAKGVDPLLDGKVTQRGVLVGSPEYMAPELLRGDNVDARTDIYAVGVLLYEAITGLTPFHGHTTAGLFMSILHDQVEPPIRYRSDCPPELQLVVLAALSRDPSQRPPNANEMAHALALVPVHASDVGTTLTELRECLGVKGTESIVWSHPAPAAMRAPADTGVQAWHRRRWFKHFFGRPALTAALALVLLPLLIASSEALRKGSAVSPHGSASALARAPARTFEQRSSPPTFASVAIAKGAARTAEARGDRERPLRLASGSGVRVPSQVRVTHKADADVRSVQELLNDAAAAFVRGDAARARELYLAVLARDPQRPEALRGLGLALNRMARNAEAARAFERYLDGRESAPDAPRIRELLALARARAQAESPR
jgi:serine/threonine-protein kinase